MTATLTPHEPGLLRTLVGSSRPLSWVNTAYPFAAAYLLAGGGVDAALVVGTVYFLVPYNLLMYGINDVFDYESDLRNARKGGVEGVVLSSRWHRATIVAALASNVPFIGALLWWGSVRSAVVLAVTVLAVVAYSAPVLRFKERPVLDSVTSSTHFVGPAVFGLVLAGGPVDTVAVCALTSFFCWGMGSQAFGAVQDIGADREAGIASIGTVLGAARTVHVALGLYVAAGLAALGTGWPGALAGLLVVPYAANVARFRSLGDEEAERAHAGWQRFLWLNYVTGFLLTQLFLWIAW
ncbi:MAG TPA: prenyltransferase [Marmoricola sp.]|nr:prenyltransferase [Marmoricola sp.]